MAFTNSLASALSRDLDFHQGEQILLFGVLSYFLGFVLLILLFGIFLLLGFHFQTQSNFITSLFILLSYFLVFFLTFLVNDMKGKPNLP